MSGPLMIFIEFVQIFLISVSDNMNFGRDRESEGPSVVFVEHHYA